MFEALFEAARASGNYPSVQLTTALALAEGVTGAGLLLNPLGAARLVAGAGSPAAPSVVRILGARMALESAVVSWSRRRPASERALILRGAAIVDALHALSMVAVAVSSRRHRRSALVSAAAATAAAAGARAVAAAGSGETLAPLASA